MIEHRNKAMAISRRTKDVSESGAITWEMRQYLCRVDIELDMDGILQMMGERAMRNKSKRSRLLGGLIKGQIQVGNEIK